MTEKCSQIQQFCKTNKTGFLRKQNKHLSKLDQKYRIRPTHFILESFEKLSEFKFSNKINSLEFRCVKTEFDPISVCKFLKETFDDDAKFVVTFGVDSHHLSQQFLPRVKEIIDGWETKKLKRAIYWL